MGLRESDPTRRFSRADAVGSGTGLGRNLSIAGRPHTQFNTPNNMINYTPDLWGQSNQSRPVGRNSSAAIHGPGMMGISRVHGFRNTS